MYAPGYIEFQVFKSDDGLYTNSEMSRKSCSLKMAILCKSALHVYVYVHVLPPVYMHNMWDFTLCQ